MRSRIWLLIPALAFLLTSLLTVSAAAQQAVASNPRIQNPRIIQTDDMGTISGWATPPTRDDIEKVVRIYAEQGADIVSWDLVGGQLADYKSKYCDLPPALLGKGSENIRHLIDSGVDLPAVLAEMSHRLGIGFWPAVRMNASARYPSHIHQIHPNWFLTGYKIWGGYRPMLNYELPEVRTFMMHVFRELVERYDADGLLLDFVRYPSLFDRDRGIEDTQLLTNYVGQVRKMLDEVGRKKGKYLPLAVQVLARPEQCRRYGEDVGAWIQRGYVQYVLPSKWNNIDFDLPLEQWTEMTHGTYCRIYPTLHPYFRFPWTAQNRVTRAALRAAAHLYYVEGADGLSTMNMFDPLLDRWLRELRDPKMLDCGPYDYQFIPAGTTSDVGPGFVSTIWFNMTDKYSWWATTPIRVADDPTRLADGTLWVTIKNAKQQDGLELSLNGKPIPKQDVAGKMEWAQYRSNQENVSRFAFPVSRLPLVKGVNQLGVLLHSSRPYKQAWVTITQIDLVVPGSVRCSGRK